MKLQLKKELKGLSISINIFGIGLVTMDTNKISEEDYIKYHKLGFQDSFIEDTREESPIVLTEEYIHDLDDVNLVKSYTGIKHEVKPEVKPTVRKKKRK